MIALVRHHFLDSVRMHWVLAFGCRFGDQARPLRIAASTTVSWTVAVSAAAPPCVVTATMAPVSMSTAFSPLYAKAVRQSFSFVISAFWSMGLFQSSLEVLFLRLRSMRSNAAASWASIPSASASRCKYAM